MTGENKMQISFISRSSNEGFARIAVSGFLAQLDPTVDELAEIKTVVSEAVTNCIVHGYQNTLGMIYITVKFNDAGEVAITIRDKGCGIEDVEKASPRVSSKFIIALKSPMLPAPTRSSYSASPP